MAGIQTIACLLLLIAVATANVISIKNGQPRNDIEECTTANKLILSKTIIADAQFWKIQEKIIHFPDAIDNPDVITCIRIIDEIGDGTGGSAVITDGGLNFKYVTVRFTSQRSHGFQFSVRIYAG